VIEKQGGIHCKNCSVPRRCDASLSQPNRDKMTLPCPAITLPNESSPFNPARR
jgi:hypothetical protein